METESLKEEAEFSPQVSYLVVKDLGTLQHD